MKPVPDSVQNVSGMDFVEILFFSSIFPGCESQCGRWIESGYSKSSEKHLFQMLTDQ